MIIVLQVTEMDEQESINEELIEFAIRESIRDADKVPCLTQANRYDWVRLSKMLPGVCVGTLTNNTCCSFICMLLWKEILS